MPVSGKAAMLMIYVPSVLFLLNYLRPFGAAFSAGELTGSLLNMGSVSGALVNNGRECLVAGMLLFHFVKRVAETLFLHKYSSKQTDGVMGACIGVYYTLTCLLITSCMVRQPINKMFATKKSDGVVITNNALNSLHCFCYHHYFSHLVLLHIPHMTVI